MFLGFQELGCRGTVFGVLGMCWCVLLGPLDECVPWAGAGRSSGATLAAFCDFSFCPKSHFAPPAAQGPWEQSCGGSGLLLLPWAEGVDQTPVTAVL